MSETPNEGSDGQQGAGNQGGQPQGGQPAGGQPQGGQPQGGQPAGGQPQGGQPAGGQPQAGAPPQGGYQQGPGVGDIFSMPETMDEIKTGVVIFGAIGVGILFAAALAPLLGAEGAVGASSMVAASLVLGPAIGAGLALRQADELDDLASNLVYATAASTAAIGTLVLGVLAGLGGTLGDALYSPPATGISFDGGSASVSGGGSAIMGLDILLLPLIFVVIGAAITGAVTVWAKDRLLEPSPPAQPRQQPAHQQNQPR